MVFASVGLPSACSGVAAEQPAGAWTIGFPTGLPVFPDVVLAGAVGVGGVPTCHQVGFPIGVVVNGSHIGETDNHTPMAAT